MVLPSPAKNALFDALFGMGLNSDILTFFICILPWTFVVARAFFIITKMRPSPKKNAQKNIDFCLCIVFLCIFTSDINKPT